MDSGRGLKKESGGIEKIKIKMSPREYSIHAIVEAGKGEKEPNFSQGLT